MKDFDDREPHFEPQLNKNVTQKILLVDLYFKKCTQKKKKKKSVLNYYYIFNLTSTYNILIFACCPTNA